MVLADYSKGAHKIRPNGSPSTTRTRVKTSSARGDIQERTHVPSFGSAGRHCQLSCGLAARSLPRPVLETMHFRWTQHMRSSCHRRQSPGGQWSPEEDNHHLSSLPWRHVLEAGLILSTSEEEIGATIKVV